MSQPSPVTYDKYGRMNYCPDLHPNHYKPWSKDDEQYLIENYAIDGPEKISLALERTAHTVMLRAYKLRKSGRMSTAGMRASSSTRPSEHAQ